VNKYQLSRLSATCSSLSFWRCLNQFPNTRKVRQRCGGCQNELSVNCMHFRLRGRVTFASSLPAERQTRPLIDQVFLPHRANASPHHPSGHHWQGVNAVLLHREAIIRREAWIQPVGELGELGELLNGPVHIWPLHEATKEGQRGRPTDNRLSTSCTCSHQAEMMSPLRAEPYLWIASTNLRALGSLAGSTLMPSLWTSYISVVS